MLRPGERSIKLFKTITIEYPYSVKVNYSTIHVGQYTHNNSLNYSYVLWPDNDLPEYELPLSIYIADFDYPNAAAIEVNNKLKKMAIDQLNCQGFTKRISGMSIRSGYVEYPIYFFPTID